jgi:hypothetical protein
MNSPDFFQNLSEEEMTTLMTMFDKVMATKIDPEAMEQQAYEQSANQYAGLFEESEALLDCPVELVFTISCNVLNKNQKGELINSEKVIVKNYHVPLNNKKEVERYIEGFFNKFHDRMEKQANETVEGEADESEATEENQG